jgi:hypothetical protein
MLVKISYEMYSLSLYNHFNTTWISQNCILLAFSLDEDVYGRCRISRFDSSQCLFLWGWAGSTGCYPINLERLFMIFSRRSSGVTYKGRSLDWTLDLSDTHAAYILDYNLQCAIANSQLQLIVYYNTHLVLSVSCPFTSPPVPASNGRLSPSWVPELFPSNSHSDSQCCLHLELPLLVSYCSVWSFVQ